MDFIIPAYAFLGVTFGFGLVPEKQDHSGIDWFIAIVFWPVIVGALAWSKVVRWLNA